MPADAAVKVEPDTPLPENVPPDGEPDKVTEPLLKHAALMLLILTLGNELIVTARLVVRTQLFASVTETV